MSDWGFGEEAACRFIAATAWPWEATIERDAWAPRIGAEPEFGRAELKRARERLNAAAKSLGLPTVAEGLAEVLDNLPSLIYETRRRRGLSLRAAASEIGVGLNVLYRVEKGRRIQQPRGTETSSLDVR